MLQLQGLLEMHCGNKKLSQPQKRSLKMWPGAGWRSRPSGRSTSLPHGTFYDQNLTSLRRTRSTKLTSSFCHMIRSDAKHISMPSPWSTSQADSKRLSLWLQKRPKRWPKNCPAFTGGDLWSGLKDAIHIWAQCYIFCDWASGAFVFHLSSSFPVPHSR